MRLKLNRRPEGRETRCGTITVEMLRKAFKLPAHAEITIQIPSGADWSGLHAVFGDDIKNLQVKVEDIR